MPSVFFSWSLASKFLTLLEIFKMAMKRRNKFSLSNYKLLTAKMGLLIPIGLYEVLPGDTIQQNTSLFIRMAAMVTPVMHPLKIRIHHWYVPFRLIWKNFEQFITGGADGMDETVPPTFPAVAAQTPGTLYDYFGVPLGKAIPAGTLSALPFRAYIKIYNEWYRDQDLEDELTCLDTDGVEPNYSAGGTARSLLNVDWSRDYFTTARPWPQKGNAVTVPFSSGVGQSIVSDGSNPKLRYVTNSGNLGSDSNLLHEVKNTGNDWFLRTNSTRNPLASDGEYQTVWGSNTGLRLGGSAGIDVNALREAFALQRFEEHRAMYGSRYTEYLRYLGIKASDSRLQRPEYLGGGSSTVQFSEVLQTSAGTSEPFSSGTPVGTLRGHGIGAMRSNRFRRFIEEHGFILTLMSAVPKSIYMQSLPRLWSRRVKEDYWQKELEHVGQQPVYTDELYFDAPPAEGRTVFGYQNRYDEYREIQSTVSGEFRGTEKYWHLARDFASKPVLNSDFLKCNPSARIFADPGTESRQAQQMYIMANHSIQARRILSRNGNPI
jgi:hypothetical protein